MIAGLLLDCDGVLAEIELDGHRRAFNQVWQEEGIPWRWTRAAYSEALQVAGGRERLMALAESADFIVAAGPLARFGDWSETTRRWHLRKTELLHEDIRRNGVQARPGVRRLAGEALAAGFRLAVVSSGAFDTVRAIAADVLGARILAQTVVVSARDVGAKKPAPDCYEVALERCGLAPEEAVAVEDSVAGLTAATRAGVRCLVTTTRATATHTFEGALAVLDCLGESPASPASARLGEPWKPSAGEVRLDDLVRLCRTAQPVAATRASSGEATG